MAIRKALVSFKDSFDKFNQLGGDVAGARPRPSTAPALDVCEWSPERLHDKSVPNTDEILKLVKKKRVNRTPLVDTQAWSCRKPWPGASRWVITVSGPYGKSCAIILYSLTILLRCVLMGATARENERTSRIYMYIYIYIAKMTLTITRMVVKTLNIKSNKVRMHVKTLCGKLVGEHTVVFSLG